MFLPSPQALLLSQLLFVILLGSYNEPVTDKKRRGTQLQFVTPDNEKHALNEFFAIAMEVFASFVIFILGELKAIVILFACSNKVQRLYQTGAL